MVDAELKKLLALYDSPEGQSIAKKMSALTEKAALMYSQISEQAVQQTLSEMGMLDAPASLQAP